MSTISWVGIGVLCLVGCGKQPDATAPLVAPAAGVTLRAATVASAPSAAPMASAAPSAPPSEPLPTEEEAFWMALARVYDSQLEQCQSGWTGDGEITIEDGKIARFTITDPGAPSKVIAGLKGKAVPPIPTSLKKALEKPTYVSVCSGGHRP